MHIGQKIAEIIAVRHSNKQALGRSIGISGSTATYLTTRKSIDVQMLANIGNALKYNFFNLYKVTEIGAESLPENIELAQMKMKNEEMAKELEACKRELLMQQRENEYLKEINDLLRKKK